MKQKILFGLLVITLLVIGTVMVSADNNDLVEGIRCYFNGDDNQAIEIFDKVLQNDNDNIDALYYQTLSLIRMARITMAKDNIQKMSRLGYKFGIIYWRLAELYLNEDGDFDSPFYNEAKKELEKAIDLGITAAGVHSDLAMAYHGLGNMKKAADEYEQAIFKGAVIEDYINLANLYKETGKLESALNIYGKALNEDTENLSIYVNMGDIYLKQSKYQQAVDIYKKALDLKPSFVAIRNKLAIAYFHNENYETALNTFKEVIKQNENLYEAYYYIAEIYNIQQKDTEMAINYYKQAIDYNSSYVKAYLALGDLYLENDQIYKAMAQYLKALENNSNYPEAHYRLALAYREMNMKQAAIEELRKTLHLNSDHEKARILLNELQEE